MEKSALVGADHTMETRHLEKLRTCGRLETYSTARHHLGFYKNVGLTATYTISKRNGQPLESLVYAALHHVIAGHANLSAIPVNEDKSHPDVYFARLPEIDLRTCVEFRSRKKPFAVNDEPDDELANLVGEQHARNFKCDSVVKPYWRLIVGMSPTTPTIFTASWFFHHALCDGASAMLFHESFLEGLNAASLTKENTPIVRTPSTKLLPPLEELNPMTISWPFLARAIAGSVLPSHFAQRNPNLWTGYPVDAIIQTPAPPFNRTVVLSAELTTAFAKTCHDKGASVTAALSTLLAGLIFGLTNPQNEIKVDIPISLRPCLPISDKQMTNAITNVPINFNCAIEDIKRWGARFSWKTAQRVKAQLANEIKRKGADNPFALLRYVSNMHEYLVEKMGKPRDSSMEVSNIGVFRPRSTGTHDTSGKATNTKWTLGRMLFSQSPNITGAQVCVSVVTGGDGCMVINFDWPEEILQYDLDGGESMLRQVPRSIKDSIRSLVQHASKDSYR